MGGERRIYAAIKFFLYTFVGSVLMLVAIIVLYFHHHAVTGVYTMDLMKLYELTIPVTLQLWLFAAFFLAFAFKVPMFPFHTWLPDAHVEAPTAATVYISPRAPFGGTAAIADASTQMTRDRAASMEGRAC